MLAHRLPLPRMIFLLILNFLQTSIALDSITTIVRGEFPIDNASSSTGISVVPDNISGFTVSSLNLSSSDFKLTFTGWIQTGTTASIATPQSKIQIFNNVSGQYSQKLLFFGNTGSTFILRQETSSSTFLAQCTVPHAFNTNYHFAISMRQSTTLGLFFSLSLQTESGTITQCSSTSTNLATILPISSSNAFLALQIQKPTDSYAFSTQKLGGVSLIKNFYYDTADTPMQRFLLSYTPNSFQVFYFRFGYETSLCDCFVDASENSYKLSPSIPSTLYLPQLSNYAYFSYPFTANQILTFATPNLRFGQITDSIYNDINQSHLASLAQFKAITLSFWIQIGTTLSSANILSFTPSTSSATTMQLSITSNSPIDTNYSLKLTINGSTTTLTSSLSSSTYYHIIITISSQFADLYINGTFTARTIGSNNYSTFLNSDTGVGSSMKFGGNNTPINSQFILAQPRMFSSSAVLTQATSAITALIANCQTLIQERTSYICLLCATGYYLTSSNTCTNTCTSATSNLLVSNTNFCAPKCAFGCLTCDSTDPTKCLSCAGNRTLKNTKCECPLNTYEDYRSATCTNVRKNIFGAESGQFTMQQVTSMTIQFQQVFSSTPKVVFSILSYSTPTKSTIDYFYLTTTSVSTTSMTVTTNSAQLLILHVQYFAYESTNTLFASDVSAVTHSELLPTAIITMNRGITYTAGLTTSYNVHMLLAGFRCKASTLLAQRERCIFSMQTNQLTITTSTTVTSRIVDSAYIYYLLTPANLPAFSSNTIAFGSSLYTSTSGIADIIHDKFNPISLQLSPLPTPLSSATNIPPTELAQLPTLLGITAFDFDANTFKYLKISPTDSIVTASNASYTKTIEVQAATSITTSLQLSIGILYEPYNTSIAFCQSLDYFTNLCTKCTNGFDPASLCTACPATYQQVLTTCICPIKTWEDTSAGVCNQCDSTCATCTSAQACTSCLGVLLLDALGKCSCPSLSLWADPNGLCLPCNSTCATCKSNSSCETCLPGLVIDSTTGFCKCPIGTWFDTATSLCQPCYITCARCSGYQSVLGDNCVTCQGDRVLVGSSCNCIGSNDSRIFTDDLRCSRLQNAVLDVQLSSDYSSLAIDFGVAILPIFTGDVLCSSIFQSSTMTLLGGSGASCSFTPKGLLVNLPGSASILKNDVVNFLPGSLKFAYNTQTIVNFYRTTVRQPSAQTGELFLGYSAIQNFCFEQIISISNLIADGKRGLAQLSWSLDSITPSSEVAAHDSIMQEVNLSNQNQSPILKIAVSMVTQDVLLSISLQWQFKVGQQGIKTIQIQITRASNIRIIPVLSQYAPFFRKDEIIITQSFATEICGGSSSGVQQTFDPVNVSISNTELNIQKTVTATTDREISLVIPKFTFNALSLYTFKADFSLSTQTALKYSKSIDIDVSLSNLHVEIIGGDRFANYKRILKVQGYFLDYELPDPSQHGMTIKWECIDLALQTPCVDSLGAILVILATGESLEFPANSFKPFTSVKFRLTGSKDVVSLLGISLLPTISKRESIYEAVIFFNDFDIPNLTVTLNESLQVSRTISPNTIIHADLLLDSSTAVILPTDINQYFCSVMYNDKVVTSVEFKYHSIRFQMQEIYWNFTESKPDFKLRFSVFNPRFLFPSIATLAFKMNFPPKSCSLTATPISEPAYAFETLYDISMKSCIDSDNNATFPLHYQFFYYSSAELQTLEILAPYLHKRKQLSDITTQNSIISILPAGNIVVLVRAIDHKGAIFNSTVAITSTPRTLTSGEYITSLDQSLQNLENTTPENKIIQLSLLSEDLQSRGAAILTVPDLLSYRSQIIGLLKTNKALILSNSSVYQLADQSISLLFQISSPTSIIPFSAEELGTQFNYINQSLDQSAKHCKTSDISQESYLQCIENIHIAFTSIDQINTKQQSISQSSMSTATIIGSMLNQFSLPNEKPIMFAGSIQSILTQRITEEFLSTYTGISQSKQQRRNRQLAVEFLRGFSPRTLQSSVSSNVYNVIIETYPQSNYAQDPTFKSYMQFVQNPLANRFEVQVPNITNVSDPSSPPPDGFILYFTNIAPSNQALTCFSKSPMSGWQTDSCSYSKNSNTNKITCLCNSSQPTTVVETQDINSAISGSNSQSQGTLGNNSNANNSQFSGIHPSFWIFLFLTLLCSLVLARGIYLDGKRYSKSQTYIPSLRTLPSSPQLRVSPIQYKEEDYLVSEPQFDLDKNPLALSDNNNEHQSSKQPETYSRNPQNEILISQNSPKNTLLQESSPSNQIKLGDYIPQDNFSIGILPQKFRHPQILKKTTVKPSDYDNTRMRSSSSSTMYQYNASDSIAEEIHKTPPNQSKFNYFGHIQDEFSLQEQSTPYPGTTSTHINQETAGATRSRNKTTSNLEIINVPHVHSMKLKSIMIPPQIHEINRLQIANAPSLVQQSVDLLANNNNVNKQQPRKSLMKSRTLELIDHPDASPFKNSSEMHSQQHSHQHQMSEGLQQIPSKSIYFASKNNQNSNRNAPAIIPGSKGQLQSVRGDYLSSTGIGGSKSPSSEGYNPDYYGDEFGQVNTQSEFTQACSSRYPANQNNNNNSNDMDRNGKKQSQFKRVTMSKDIAINSNPQDSMWVKYPINQNTLSFEGSTRESDAQLLKDMSAFKFIIAFHSFLGIFYVRMVDLWRSSRCYLFYFHCLHTLAMSIVFTEKATQTEERVSLAILSSILVSLFVHIVSSLHLRNVCLRTLGSIITFIITCVYLFIVLSIIFHGLTDDERTNYIQMYIILAIVDGLGVMTITMIVNAMIASSSIRIKNSVCCSVFFRLFDLHFITSGLVAEIKSDEN